MHEWKNYVNEEVRSMWASFTEQQRAALARNADDIASQEEWD